MSTASVAEQWSEHFLSTSFDRLPDDVVEQAKQALLDYLRGFHTTATVAPFAAATLTPPWTGACSRPRCR